MLKFLDNRNHQKSPKSPKKYHPQFLYGNSFECPKQFQTGATLFYKPSYVNPYLQYQAERLLKIPWQSMPMINPEWKVKLDLQSVEEQKNFSSSPDTQNIKQSRYIKSFYREYDQNKARFRKTRGQFTSFIQKNNKFKSLGPLHGDQRSQTRINQTKKNVWLKKNNSMRQTLGQRSLLNSSDRNYSIKSSALKNSCLITEKQLIRQNRQKVYLNYKRSLERRKYDKPNSHLFQLPKKGSQHELTFFRPRYRREDLTYQSDGQSQISQQMKELDTFETSMSQKIK